VRRLAPLAAAIVLAAAGCADDASETAPPTVGVPTTSTAPADPAPTSSTRPPPPPIPDTAGSLDTQPLSGNRIYGGSGVIATAEPLDVDLGGTPSWVVAIPGATAASWMVALEDGRLVLVRDGAAQATGITIDPGAPPVIVTEDGRPVFAIGAPRSESSPASAARVDNGSLWWVGLDGRLVREKTGAQFAFDVGVLADSRIAIRDDGVAAVLAQPTDRYPHGIAGDAIEAGALAIVEPLAGEVTTFPVDDVAVVEGTSPMWIDADGDGIEELLVTLSDASGGARLTLFSASGERLADGPPVGLGNRWRHQIGAGPVGPNGEFEIVAVETPHIGGIAQWYRFEDGELRIVAEATGVTSHVIYSRNMDMALIADADGDGAPELVTPTQDRSQLTGLARTAAGADEAWTVPLDGRLVSNLAAAPLGNGGLAVAAGTDTGVLRIWQP
jgi:hypothetical protein